MYMNEYDILKLMVYYLATNVCNNIFLRIFYAYINIGLVVIRGYFINTIEN